jgi:hypothetical protein
MDWQASTLTSPVIHFPNDNLYLRVQQKDTDTTIETETLQELVQSRCRSRIGLPGGFSSQLSLMLTLYKAYD